MPLRSRDLAGTKRLWGQKKEVPERSASDYCMANAAFGVVYSETKSKTEKERVKTQIGDHQDGHGSLHEDQEKLVIKIELSKDNYVFNNPSIHDNDERLEVTYTINNSKNDRVELDTNLGNLLSPQEQFSRLKTLL